MELILYCAIVAVPFGGIFYWTFILPERAQRRRRELLGECGGKGGHWDRRIY